MLTEKNAEMIHHELENEEEERKSGVCAAYAALSIER